MMQYRLCWPEIAESLELPAGYHSIPVATVEQHIDYLRIIQALCHMATDSEGGAEAVRQRGSVIQQLLEHVAEARAAGSDKIGYAVM